MGKILIVEDHSELRNLLEIVLRKEARLFFHADNGVDALRIARRERPDVIVLDVKLNGAMNGYDAARQLRSFPETRDSAILFVTARVFPTDKMRAIEAGGDEHIAKPFKLAFLKKQVEKYLNDSRRSRGLRESDESHPAMEDSPGD